MLNIKEIAEQVSKRIYVEDGLLLSKFISEKFAEAIIESYKAELLKEVGEPVAYYDPDLDCGSAGISFDPLSDGIGLHTSDQVAAAILKATGPLEEEIEQLKATPPDKREDLRCVISDLCRQVQERDAKLASSEQLAAEQLNNKLLREALEFLNARIVTMDLGGVVERALSTPASTEALDAYVAEKVKEAMK